MVFVNEHEAEGRIGLACAQEGEVYVLTVVDRDGAETRTTCGDEDTMIAETVRIHLALLDRGWRALSKTR